MMLLDVMLFSEGFVALVEAFDKECLLAVNGSDSLYLDRVVRSLTNALVWIPFYLSLFFLVLKNNATVRQVVYILIAIGLCVFVAGSLDDLIVKPLVARWRPTHDPEIGMMVDIVDGYRGGKYGFFSAHAANTFSVAIFFCWLVRSRLLSIAIISWSLTNCWTRLYLGVHFPGDIIVGLTWALIVSTIVYFIYWRLTRHINHRSRHSSTKYTSTGYLIEGCNIPISVLVFTLAVILIKACII